MTDAAREVCRRFKEAVLAADMDAVEELLADDVVFRSPAVFKPYEGKVATMVILRSVERVFEGFHYTRTFAEEDGRGFVLVFEATVAGRSLEGADYLRVGDSGLVADLRVMVRPLSGLNALLERMRETIPVVMEELGLPTSGDPA